MSQDHADRLRYLRPHAGMSLPILENVEERVNDLEVVEPAELVRGGFLNGRVQMVEKLDQEPTDGQPVWFTEAEELERILLDLGRLGGLDGLHEPAELRNVGW